MAACLEDGGCHLGSQGPSNSSSAFFRTACCHDGHAVLSDRRASCARPMEVVFLARLNSEVKS